MDTGAVIIAALAAAAPTITAIAAAWKSLRKLQQKVDGVHHIVNGSSEMLRAEIVELKEQIINLKGELANVKGRGNLDC